MNIDEMKVAWSSQPAISTPNQDWKALLKSNGRNPLQKLKRKTRSEMFFSVLIFLAIVIYFGYQSWLEASVYLCLGIVSYLFSRKQLRLINTIENLDLPVRNSLLQHIHSLQTFLKRQILYSTLMMPPLLVFGIGIFYKKTGVLPVTMSSNIKEDLLPFSVFIIGITLFMYITMRITSNIKYGVHIRALKQKAAQLD